MENVQAAEKISAELTCWKCGENMLKEAVIDTTATNDHGEKSHLLDFRHSDCQKCGAYSVNSAQAHHNKAVARKNRKALIREANRSSK